MASQPDCTIVIDDRLESYKTFFDFDWARRIMGCAEGTKLAECVFGLCLNWRAAANTHLVPWFAVTSMASFAKGMRSSHEPLGVKVINALATRLPAEMGDSMRNMQRQKLAGAIRRLGMEVYDALEREKDLEVLQAESFWKLYLQSPHAHEFRLILWGSQRICYGAVYHAYEDFVRECAGIASGDRKSARHSKSKELMELLGKHFGQQLAEDCLDAPEVEAARCVRNALAHEGGTDSDRLRRVPHGIRVEDGVLQIMAPDTGRLFNLLKERAYRLVEHGVTLGL
ncbi:MAG: hypothetical protein ACYC35_27270 [Pirellulales bacterium]